MAKQEEGVVRKNNSLSNASKKGKATGKSKIAAMKAEEMKAAPLVTSDDLVAVKIDITNRCGEGGTILTDLLPFQYKQVGTAMILDHVGGSLHSRPSEDEALINVTKLRANPDKIARKIAEDKLAELQKG